MSSNFVGIRFAENKLQLYVQGMPLFEKTTRPVIPGITFDAYLCFEPSANIAEYTYNGVAYQMTDEQKTTCLQYASSIEIPVFTYDPKRYNIYSGIMTQEEAEADGLRFTYTNIKNEKCKFNETENCWDDVVAIVCQEGSIYTEWNNDFRIDYENGSVISAASNSASAAVLFLTQSEYNTFIVGRVNDTDKYDFKTSTWIQPAINLEYAKETSRHSISGIIDYDLKQKNIVIDEYVFNISKLHGLYALSTVSHDRLCEELNIETAELLSATVEYPILPEQLLKLLPKLDQYTQIQQKLTRMYFVFCLALIQITTHDALVKLTNKCSERMRSLVDEL